MGGDDEPAAPGVINIAVPPAPSANNVRAIASFHRYVETLVRPCTATMAPDAAILTVTNIDNSQSTTCTNTLTLVLPTGIDIMLHTEIFSEIGDVSDAPIPVRVSW